MKETILEYLETRLDSLEKRTPSDFNIGRIKELEDIINFIKNV